MTKIYDVILKRHNDESKNVCIFYDEDREKSIKQMSDYNKKHGFSIEEKGHTYSIANILLRERKATGEVLIITTFRELFDVYGNRLSN